MNYIQIYNIYKLFSVTLPALLRTVVVLFFISMATTTTFATHIVGGELYYHCLGNNQYEIVLTVYRDCFYGVAEFDDPASIGVFDGISNQIVTEVEIPFDPAINDTLFVEEVNPCLEIEGDVCIHQTIYKDTITLGFRSGGYTLAYQRCCRNAAIINIPQPLETGATYIARITERALQECDSSPVFNDWPPVFICVNRPIDFDHAATDADGDSLVYRLCTPYTGATIDIPKPQPPSFPPYDTVTYLNPYNLEDLMGNPENPLTIDSETGFLTGIPTIKGQYVVGICVDEYRDGQLISTTRRDFQYIVGDCTEITSAIGNPSIQCDDLTVDFINTSLDATEFVWEFGDPANPGASSTLANPSYTYPDTGIYTVRLISHPGDVCGDTLDWTLSLKTSTLEPDFNFLLLKCSEGVEIVVENLSTDPVQMIEEYLWELSDGQTSTLANPIFTYLGTENPTLTLYATASDGCTRSISTTIDLSTIPTETPRDTLNACVGDVLELFPDGPLFSNIIYNWTPTDGLDDAMTLNPTHTASESQLYTLTLTADNSDCTAAFEKYINVSDVQNIDIEATLTSITDGSTTTITDSDEIIVCYEELVTLTTININTTLVDFMWTDEAGNPLDANPDGSITVNPDGSMTYSVVVTDEFGCTAEDAITLTANPVELVIEEIDQDTTNGSGLTDINGDGTLDLCAGDVSALTVTNLDAQSTYTYQWTGDTQLINDATSPTPTVQFDDSGVYTLYLLTTNEDNCVRNDTVMVEIHPYAVIDIDAILTDLETNMETTITGEDQIVSCDDGEIILTTNTSNATTTDFTIQWLDAEGNVLGEEEAITVDPDGSVTYTLQVTTPFGCQTTTEITIDGSPIDIAIDQTIIDTDGNGYPDADVDSDGFLDLCINEIFALEVLNNDPEQILTYQWTADASVNVFGATTANAAVEPTQSGMYNIYLETTNQYGCSQMDTIPVSVLDVAEPIDFAHLQDCIGFTVNFSTDNPNYEYYTWNFGDPNGTTMTAVQSPSFTYPAAGTYTVTLTPLEGIGCGLDTISKEVLVDDSIVDIAYTYDYTSCDPDAVTIQFTDASETSQGNIVSWEWQFSNGQTFNIPNPSITLTENINLEVVLTITNDTDCSGSFNETLVINIPTAITFPDDLILCSYDAPIVLNPDANPDYIYEWSPAVGLSCTNCPNPTANPDATTTYNVTITDNTGAVECQFEQSVTVQVSDEIGLTLDAEGTISGPFVIDNTTDTNTITTCEEEQVTVNTSTTTGTATDYTWTWEPAISGTTQVTLGSNGSTTLSVTVTDELGCMEEATITVEGGPVEIEIEETSITNSTDTGNDAVVNADGSIDLCLGTSFELTVTNLDSNDTLSYTWTGDPILEAGTENTPNPVLNPTTPGQYVLYLETENQYGCTRNDTIPVTVVDPGDALDFNYIKECDGVTVNFMNNSDPLFDYIWTFSDPNNGDGFANTYDAVYVYNEVGTYDVTLEMDVNLACVAPLTQQVAIFDPILTADFDYTLVDCGPEGMTILFTDQSLNPDNNTTSIEWLINGESYTGASVEITFTENTTFDVEQTIYTANDCETSAASTDLVIDIIEDVQLVGDLTHCQNDEPIALNPNGNEDYTYVWSPTNGLSCADCPNPMADPETTTTYSVTITNNASLLPCSIVREVTLDVPPAIELAITDSFATDCEDAAQLTVSGNLQDLTFEWFEGDNTTPFSDATQVDVTPSGAVTYTVVATHTASGCTEEISTTITGTGINVTIPTLEYFCEGGLGQITVTNDDPNDELTFQWEGDNILDIQGGTIFIPTNMCYEATYAVTVTNQYNCTATGNITAVVLAEPQAPNTGQCEGLTMNFVNDFDCNAPYYIWDFGDGSDPTTAGTNPTHTYETEGNYTVTLSLPNGTICHDALMFDVEVNDDNGEAAFDATFDMDCGDMATVSFTDTSVSGNLGTIDSWQWDLGDYGVFDEQNPTIEVTQTDTIMGTLTMTTDANCVITGMVNVPVEIVNQEVTIADVINCANTIDTLNPNPTSGYSFEWSSDFGNNPSPVVEIDGNQTYTVTITNDAQGCTGVQEVNVAMHDLINIDIITEPEDAQQCDDVEVVLTADADVPVTYTWTTAGGFEETGSSITVATGDGLSPTTYTVTGEDAFGCTQQDEITVANNAIAVDIELRTDYSCESGIALDDAVVTTPGQQSIDDELTYQWSGGPMEGATTSSPTFIPEETTEYTVVITNQYACTLEESVTIAVSDVFDINSDITASPDTIYLGNEVELSTSLGDYEYVWTGDGVNTNTAFMPSTTAVPENAGEIPYEVTISDPVYEECNVTTTIAIIVLERICDEPFIFFPNAFTPNNDGENDRLQLRFNPAHVTDASWAIYNRWGQKVFETEDLNAAWDGTFEGELVAPDVYGFWLRVRCADGEEFHKQGNVTVLR